MESQVQVRQAVWSRYWSHGIAHSCGGSYGNRYEGALARFWLDAFAGLAPGARVLDLATGNGPLPRLLLDSGAAATSSCDAVDLARVEPAWLGELAPPQRARIRFHGEQAAEQLPFADGRFAMVVSQYGIEYTDLARTVPELLRVLAPGGAVRLVCHHVEARPVQLAAAELDHLAWLQQDGGLLDQAGAMIRPMALAATEAGRAALAGDAAAHAARERFNALQGQASELAERSACPDVLMEVRQAIAGILSLAHGQGDAAATQAMQQLRQELADSAVRLGELRDYALDEAGARRLCAALAGSAGTVALAPIEDEGILMGWAMAIDPA